MAVGCMTKCSTQPKLKHQVWGRETSWLHQLPSADTFFGTCQHNLSPVLTETISPFPLALGFTPVLPDHSVSTLSPCLHIAEEERAEVMAPLACTAPDIPSASFFTLWGLYLVYYVVQVRNITFFTANIKSMRWITCKLAVAAGMPADYWPALFRPGFSKSQQFSKHSQAGLPQFCR